GSTEPLEACELRLDRDAFGTGGVDRRAAVKLDRLGCELGGLALAIAHGLDRDLPKRGRVGVEAENDLALSLLD
ncbi:MAG TPA: hypothetical protein VFN82_06195, partial [Solirubrobacterales bacterium]|nr:hypothetical protein [Solirubrobacterales bacterium]